MKKSKLLWSGLMVLLLSSCEGIDVEPNRRLLISGQIQTANPSEAEGLRLEFVTGTTELSQSVLRRPESFRQETFFEVLGLTSLDGQGRFRMTSLEARGSRLLGVNLPGTPDYDSDYATLVVSAFPIPLPSTEFTLETTTLERVRDSRLEVSRSVFTGDTLEVSIRYASRVKAIYLQDNEFFPSDQMTDFFRLLPGELSESLEFTTREGSDLEIQFFRINGGVQEEGSLTLSPDANQIYRYAMD